MSGELPLGPLMFVAVFAIIFSGYPVAFALGGTSLMFAFIGVQAGYFEWSLMSALPERTFGIMSNYILLAVPFFIFMGTMLEKSRLAEDLLKTIGALFGPLRGGLALAVVFVGAMLAAATGVVGASVVAMGLISLPVMLRYGYSKELATGVITASGTLGQIIPPSVVLIVLADQMGISVGDLFVGALLPGLMLAGMYALYVIGVAVFKPEAAPALPVEERPVGGAALARQVVLVLIPPLALILLVLGSIFVGIATPTEAGALGAMGAMVLAAVNGRLTREALTETMRYTTRLTAMVIFLLIGSTAFALVFRGLNGDVWIEGLLTDLPGGKLGLLVVANLAIFILGFFIDFFEIAFILLPLIVPAAEWAGVSLVWFGVMIGMNLQTSFLTPPFGFALFYLRGVAPDSIPTSTIYRGVMPFIGIQLLGLALICIFPQMVTWYSPGEMHEHRYCEVRMEHVEDGLTTREVWSSRDLGECPQAALDSLDAELIKGDLGATSVLLSGPRRYLFDSIAISRQLSGSGDGHRRFGSLSMAKTEHTQGAPSTSPGAPAYVERPVERDADFLFSQGAEVFELLSPEDRKIYVMQSYSLSGTPELSHNDLFSLGNRLEFPEGWRYRVHTLDRDLISSARGATIQDELGNIYQLVE